MDRIADDLWIDTFCFLELKDVARFARLCHKSRDLFKSKHLGMNRYWEQQSKIFCSNVSSNYTTQHWKHFYFELRKFIAKNKYISRYNKKHKTSNQKLNTNMKGIQIDEFDINTLSNFFDPDDDTKTSKLKEGLPNHIHWLTPIAQCCIADTPMIFEMILTKSNYYNHIIKEKAYWNQNSKNFNRLDHKYGNKFSILMNTIMYCLKYQSMNMLKYIFNNSKYYDNIEMKCADTGKNNFHYNYSERYLEFQKSTLLNEAIKTNNNEIIRMVLKHNKMDKKTINMFSESTGMNALHQACWVFYLNGKKSQRLSKNTIRLMINKGIDINAKIVATKDSRYKHRDRSQNTSQIGWTNRISGVRKVGQTPLISCIEALYSSPDGKYLSSVVLKQLIYCLYNMYSITHGNNSDINININTNIKDNMEDAIGMVYTPLMVACAVRYDLGLKAVKLFLKTYDKWEAEDINTSLEEDEDADGDEDEDGDGEKIAHINVNSETTRQQFMSLFDVKKCTTGGVFNVFHAAVCNKNYEVIKYLLQYCEKHKVDRNINIKKMITASDSDPCLAGSPYALAQGNRQSFGSEDIVQLFDQYL